jgi:uncharacterized phage protein (TIGR02218 family)
MKASDANLRALLHGSTQAAFVNLVTVVTDGATTVRWSTGGYDVVYSGNTYTAGGTGTAPGIAPFKLRETVGLEVSTLELEFSCGRTAQIGGVELQLAALNGVLDDARVTVMRAYMATPGGTVVGAIHRFAGLVSDCEVDSYTVRLRVQSDLYRLEEQLPRHLIREKCSWSLGDVGCGVNLASFTTTPLSVSGSTAYRVKTDQVYGLTGIKHIGGTVKFTSGSLSGQKKTISSVDTYTSGSVYLVVVVDVPFSADPSVGDSMELVLGCDKTIDPCLNTFSNLTRRRGFDFVPPPDYVTR